MTAQRQQYHTAIFVTISYSCIYAERLSNTYISIPEKRDWLFKSVSSLYANDIDTMYIVVFNEQEPMPDVSDLI